MNVIRAVQKTNPPLCGGSPGFLDKSIGYGIDIVSVKWFEGFIAQMGEDFEGQYLTDAECHCSGFRTNRIQYLASRLAAKKAVLKAMGQDEEQPTLWREIEIQHLPTGEPQIMLYDNCQKMAAELGVARWFLSISHTPCYGAASAIAVFKELGNLAIINPS